MGGAGGNFPPQVAKPCANQSGHDTLGCGEFRHDSAGAGADYLTIKGLISRCDSETALALPMKLTV